MKVKQVCDAFWDIAFTPDEHKLMRVLCMDFGESEQKIVERSLAAGLEILKLTLLVKGGAYGMERKT